MILGKWRDAINTLCKNTFFRNYIVWIPAFLIAAAIFTFSHQPAEESTVASDGLSHLLLYVANKFRLLDINNVDLEKAYQLMAVPVRKSAHAIEFAALDAALLFALYFRNMRGRYWLKTALFMTVIYACSDEFHQLFIPGRAGLVTDVFVDSMGAILITAGIAMVNAVYRKVKDISAG